MRELDRTDIELCILLNERPKAGVREYARVLGVARATVSSRIDKLVERGVIGSFAPVSYTHLTLPTTPYV